MDNDFISEAPTLKGFFKKFSNVAALNYCVVCLRTEDERRLGSNKSFKAFSNAVKINKSWQHHLICHVCERQARNALKFYKAATFAAAIDTIFAELLYHQKNKKVDVFNPKVFTNILRRFGLGANGMSTPKNWEEELITIRKNSHLQATFPLVVDSVVTAPSHRLTPPEQYVVPDDPPDCSGNIIAIASRAASLPMFPLSMVPTPIDPLAAARDDTFVLGSPEPKVSETLVILDDDDDKDPFGIRIQKIESTAPVHSLGPPPSTSQAIIVPNLVLAPNDPLRPTVPSAPRLVPLETLLEKPKEIFTGDGLLIGTGGQYTLHPIAIKEGVTTIPSLDAKIINGTIVQNNLLNMNGLETTALKDIIDAPTKLPGNGLFAQNPAMLGPFLATNSASTVAKRLDSVDDMVPRKVAKMLPGTAEKGDRIDWEDKIPMDVISFMDPPDPSKNKKIYETVRVTDAITSPADRDFELVLNKSGDRRRTYHKPRLTEVIDLS